MKLTWSAAAVMIVSAAAWANGEGAKVTGPEEYAFLDSLSRLEGGDLPQDDELERLKKAAAQEKEREKEDLPARVSKLEKLVEAQKPTWNPDKMLSFSTPDGNFTAKVGGRIYANYRHTFERNDARGFADGFFLDTARMQLDGTFYKDFFYRVEGELQTSKAGAMLTKDCYVGWSACSDSLAFQAGQMKTPWSQEETCSSRFIDFGERSILNRLAPGHDQGLMAKGSFLDKIVEYNLGLFNGAYARDGGRNAANPDDTLDLAGRLFLTPFKTSEQPALENLRVGVDFTWGDRDDVALGSGISNGDWNGVTVNPFAAASPMRADGIQTRRLLNFSWIYKGASLRAELADVTTSLNDVPASLESSFVMKTWYVQGTYLLTGENKPLENRVKPDNNLSLTEGTWGALELAARMAYLDTDDGVGAGVEAATANAKTRELTAGINWWWTPNVALRLDWENFKFDQELAISSSEDRLADDQSILYVRWQIDF